MVLGLRKRWHRWFLENIQIQKNYSCFSKPSSLYRKNPEGAYMKIQFELDSVKDQALLAFVLKTAGVISTSVPPDASGSAQYTNGHEPVMQTAPLETPTTTVFTDAPPVKRKGGRPSNLEKQRRREAEEAAAAAAQAAHSEDTRPDLVEDISESVQERWASRVGEVAAPPAAVPAGMFPPGVTPPGVMPTQAAVPQASPPPSHEDGTVVPLEVFRDAMKAANNRAAGAPFVLLKSPKWPDGSDKPVWFSAESVGAEYRERLMQHWDLMA
jgi:hypothetical protein